MKTFSSETLKTTCNYQDNVKKESNYNIKTKQLGCKDQKN